MPTDELAAALRIASEDLTVVGRQLATSLLGCPRVDDAAALFARVDISLLIGTTLCGAGRPQR